MTILIFAEHDNKTLNAATLPVVSAAQKIGGEIHILVAGKDCASVATQAAAVQGISKVLHVDDVVYEHALAENLATLLAKISGDYTHIFAPATFFGKNVIPRVAGLLDIQPISDVTGIESADTFTRPIHAGNAYATIQVDGTLKILTIRPTAFDAAPREGGSAVIDTIASAGETGLTAFVSRELSKSERPDLATAEIVISGGRGLGSAENFNKVLEPLADKLNAAIGASRAAVDAGYAANDLQVGQTGKVVAPKLYFAIGISGAIQHLAGMKGSKTIVAINKDPDAPIFKVADYGLVADLFQAVPDIQKALG
jgi:electron transfer flavoprotein alpha subunit